MNTFNPSDHPHRRWNPLTEEWILVSPHRAKRPWKGKVEPTINEDRPTHEPSCYLCPGNTRAGGQLNPNYDGTFVFDNDFAALLPEPTEWPSLELCSGLVRAKAERGLCRVVCFSPRHDLTLAEMQTSDVRRVIDVWAEQCEELASMDFINAVTIFENKGDMMGCSNPHPHGQIWANESIPIILAKEADSQNRYFCDTGGSLLIDYLGWEIDQGTRIVLANSHFVALVPHWALWPFETMIAPYRRSICDMNELRPEERDAWADLMRQLLVRYDNLFEMSFPYSMGVHQAPRTADPYPGFQMHQHFYPPLLRSATVRKFLVGYEMMGEPQRDITAEEAAERLRGLSEVHYRTGRS